KEARLHIETLDLGNYKGRAEISAAKFPLLNAVKKIIEERREFWPLSDRQIHYPLLNDPPLIHASKPDSIYRNDKASYKALVDLLTRARLARLIPMEVIADPTRPVTVWNVHSDCQGYVRVEFNGLLKNYWRDLLQS